MNLISVSEAAKILGLTPIAVYKKVSNGKIKNEHPGNRFVLIDKSKLAKYVRAKGRSNSKSS